MTAEYNSTEMRELLVQLFPYRKLVLSQFTFFNNRGVIQATGSSVRRGRRCYRLQDILAMGCVLALKEHGIPLKNIEHIPATLRPLADKVMAGNCRCRIVGCGSSVSVFCDEEVAEKVELERFISDADASVLFWSFDVSALALRLVEVAAAHQALSVQVAA